MSVSGSLNVSVSVGALSENKKIEQYFGCGANKGHFGTRNDPGQPDVACTIKGTEYPTDSQCASGCIGGNAGLANSSSKSSSSSGNGFGACIASFWIHLTAFGDKDL